VVAQPGKRRSDQGELIAGFLCGVIWNVLRLP
jgi:hypothetical protein